MASHTADHRSAAPTAFRLLMVFTASAVALLILVVGASAYYGSFSAAKAVLTGKPVVLEFPFVSVGAVQGDSLVEASFRFVNHSNKTATVVGAATECSCLATRNLPLEVPAGQVRQLPVEVNTTGKSGMFSEPITFFIDWNGVYPVPAQLVGTVSRSPEAEKGGEEK